MPNVAFVTEEARAKLPLYNLIKDCLAGEAQVKFRRELYLPKPDPTNTSPENVARYNAYITRALFYNVASITLAGLAGQIFLRDPVAEVPASLDMIKEDATGSGVPLDQLAAQAVDFVLPYGRCGLYVDYPETDAPTSKEEQEAGELRPTITAIDPIDLINWRVKKRGAKQVLSLVVFREDYDIQDDGFETKKGSQWRALRLDDEDRYYIEVYRDRLATAPVQTYYPKNAKGEFFDEVAFTFIGAKNNEPKPDQPPMYPLCSVNIAHYRNSADYEDSIYMLGQPTPWFAGLTEEWVKNVLGGVVQLGARGSVLLPVDASAGLLQAEPNTMAKEGMDQKEAQMIALGAKLVEGSQVERTATEANHDNTSEQSVLSSVAKNVGSGIEWGLKKAAEFVGDEGSKIEYKLNSEFDLMQLSPEDRKQLLAEWTAQAITFSEYRASLRRSGVATLDDKAAKAELDAEGAEALEKEVEKTTALVKADPTLVPAAPGGA